jgi:hypothetical protein
VTLHRLVTAIWLAGFFALCAVSSAGASDAPAAPMQLAQAQPLQAPAPAAPPAPLPSPDANAPADQQAASDEPIGNVASLTGVATVIRNKDSIALKLKDDIYLNDTVQTAASSSLGITFNDATTFHLSANAKITIDTYVYTDGGSNNNGAFDIAKGTVAFVAAQVAKTGNMQITTPTATLGIRGTTGLVEVPEDGAAAANANNVNIKLYPDPDGHVGRIEVNDRQGARLGALSSGASGFSIRPGTAGARFAAVPLTISPQQQARDQGFVRQVHATQTVGRQIVTEQRAFRRANPGLNNRNNPARPNQPGQQPGQNRPGQPGQRQPGQPQPGQNRPGQPQQPGTPNNRQDNRQGQQPGQPGQGGEPARPGQPGQPARPGQTTPGQTTPGQTTPGQTTPPANPAAPGTPPRAGQNTPAGPAQPGASPRPGEAAQPARPGQPGAPAQPNAVPRTGQPSGRPTPPPLPNGQPLLRQSGAPRPAPGFQRPGFQHRPAVARPKPPPKDKKKR